MRGLPYGWHALVDHSWVWIGPKGERAVKAIVCADLNVPYSFTTPQMQRHERAGPAALARIEGWTTFDDRYLPIGGLLADVKATKKVRFNREIASNGHAGIADTAASRRRYRECRSRWRSAIKVVAACGSMRSPTRKAASICMPTCD
jgi:hypothetical protein